MLKGVSVRLPDGGVVSGHPTIVTTEVPQEPFDIVLLTVKAYAVAGSLDRLRSLLHPAGVVIAFQNGVGSDEALVGRFGVDRVAAATSTISVGVDTPGVVSQYTTGGLAWAPY